MKAIFKLKKMKQIIFGLFLVSITLFSCKKDASVNHDSDNKPLQKVTLSVGFASSSGSFQTNKLKSNALKTTAADTALTNHINTLVYAVYDSNGQSVLMETQLSTDSAFGHYSFHLSAGTYFLVIAGGGTGLYIKPNKYISYMPINDPNEPHPYSFTNDTFANGQTLVITNEGLNRSVTLTRVTSRLDVTILDAIPASVKSISVVIRAISQAYEVRSASSLRDTTPYKIFKNVTPDMVGKSNYKFSAYFLGYREFRDPVEFPNGGVADVPASVLIQASDHTYPATSTSFYSNIAAKSVSATPKANTIISLSGYLFGGNGTGAGGINLGVDTAWNSSIISKSF